MGFAQAVQWWEAWQLRVLVLSSLFLQFFLFVAAIARKRRPAPWFRFLTWVAYMGCDALAVYALATLFNRHNDRHDEPVAPSAGLEVLWAPLILLHLGGQDGITAYSIQDNELWRRHFVIAASQIAVAVYVFCRSGWSGDGRLLRAAILLFIPGAIKCLEKPLALKKATATSIVNASDLLMVDAIEDEGNGGGAAPERMDSLESFVQAARQCVKVEAEGKNPLYFDVETNSHPYQLFVDLAHPYCIRLKNLQAMAAKKAGREDAHGRVRAAVSRAFDRFYTKHKASYGGLLRAVLVLLTFVVIGLFQERRRSRYARADVIVTYILLCCTAALELVSASVVLCSGLPEPDDSVAQYNLIGCLARSKKKKHRRLRRLSRLLGFGHQLDWIGNTERRHRPSCRITELVHDHIASGWTGYKDSGDDGKVAGADAGVSKGVESKNGVEIVKYYRQFNDCRGQRTLKREGLFPDTAAGGKAIAESLSMPFDESVLVWHLATEFCYFDHVDAGSDATRYSRVISNYMAYLLFVRPGMLVPGARRKLFEAVYIELREMLKEKPWESEDEDDEEKGEKKTKKKKPRAMDEIARTIIQKVRDPPKKSCACPRAHRASADLVRKAWDLAHDLMEFAKKKVDEHEPEVGNGDNSKGKKIEPVDQTKKGDERMWEVIQGVWVEMLCFSAGRCRGYLHAKSLSNGGEYLTYVWLLLSYMGMETMAERMQRTTELPAEGDPGALVRTSALDDDEEEEGKPTATAPTGDSEAVTE
ncbi:unnamed protein product [Urochloa decumbens]|uniref:DUF4220 domain-containing protein n=1 Tax=Urochloa decumbens TaxID=240449 RepID=A0ABC9H6F6_9POAL